MNALADRTVSTEAKGQRTPLGHRSMVEISQTVLRVVGKGSKTPALDVAAFQSFAD
jgi:hypothetical protein